MTESRFMIDDGIIAWFDGPEWDDVVLESFKDASSRVQEAAQENAIWEDQTGDARAGLKTDVVKTDGAIYLTLYHTVSYGYWLEVIQSGKFAIIMKTLEEQGKTVFSEATRRVKNARRGNPF